MTPVLSKRDPRASSWYPYVLVVLWVFANGVGWIVISALSLSRSVKYYILAATTLVIFWTLIAEIRAFHRVGLVGADKEIRHGVDYDAALRLCSNELSFLGIGAAKLTSEKRFEETLRRCKPDVPIRFLLSKPSRDNLERAARRAARDRDEYKHVVLNSLRTIADVRKRRSLDIEVRFYPPAPHYIPIFRLMLIDRELCLLSYNVFGEGSGSQLPQLHLAAPVGSAGRDVDSLYWAFEQYFNWLWNLSDSWDFEEYLDSDE